MADFIPVGRTSLARRGDTALQVQTEYAARPNPRITTTISENGRVVHKVERPLGSSISSYEQQRETEEQMRRQHAAVVGTIQGGSQSDVVPPNTGLQSARSITLDAGADKTDPPVKRSVPVPELHEPTIVTTRQELASHTLSVPAAAEPVSSEPAHAPLSYQENSKLLVSAYSQFKPTVTHDSSFEIGQSEERRKLVDPNEETFTMKSPASIVPMPPVSLADRLRLVAGVQRLIELDEQGKFIGDEKTTSQFRKLFAPVLKNLRELLAFFVVMEDGTRERGFYPIEPGRLYLVSSGKSFYFVLVYDADNPNEIEHRLREVI